MLAARRAPRATEYLLCIPYYNFIVTIYGRSRQALQGRT